ncbi:carbohydrate esterase family 4 protein [Cylindrobasidium torrendii FP15055 ss-10]|uniref:chitin deacetylase n=1 Tax=Cylindrobasidium torrendii FP15055 ss-10 TaxID=1314674 RepID=A0A0D7BA82_9AGAR|nr:carbohydrate esterase family 4 protein [Cylindrobasidium torrendii FP15055 ss-10]
MRLHFLLSVFAAIGAANAHNLHHAAAKHQATGSNTSSSSPSSSSSASAASASGSSTSSSSGGGGSASNIVEVPPLNEITLGMPTGTVWAASTTYNAGTKPTISGIDNAPNMPAFVFQPDQWPTQDKPPPTDSEQVKVWMKELEGHNIPDLKPTTDGTCLADADLAKDAESRGWWTCGGWTRSTDIVACKDKLTWGVSFDDGPSPYTPKLLKYLDEKDISATFFVVGSRVIERPAILRQEYMSGHEISVHTWSHTHLTTQTTEQIVAELGWTRSAIQAVLGVTPTTMRPPYGDIDDRVRAISLAMGMVPIMWTRTQAATFDTNDWGVAAGLMTGEECIQTFNAILGNASQLDTGMIVLAHDLFEITVDLNVGFNLEAAQSHNPAFTLKAIGQCMNLPPTDLYRETNTNKTFPGTKENFDVDGDGKADTALVDSVSDAAVMATSCSLAMLTGFFAVLVGLV